MTQWINSGSKGQWLNLMKSAIAKRFALDMLRIGFNGTSIATVTDPVNNPLGQDVNKGWLAIVKEKKRLKYFRLQNWMRQVKQTARIKIWIHWFKI